MIDESSLDDTCNPGVYLRYRQFCSQRDQTSDRCPNVRLDSHLCLREVYALVQSSFWFQSRTFVFTASCIYSISFNPSRQSLPSAKPKLSLLPNSTKLVSNLALKITSVRTVDLVNPPFRVIDPVNQALRLNCNAAIAPHKAICRRTKLVSFQRIGTCYHQLNHSNAGRVNTHLPSSSTSTPQHLPDHCINPT